MFVIERLYQHRVMSELRAVGAEVGKLNSFGAETGKRFCAIIAGVLLLKSLSEAFVVLRRVVIRALLRN